MKNTKALLVQRRAVILILVISVAALLEPAYCQAPRIVLLVKQTPPYGGTTIPAVGLHYFDPNALVTLTAIPESGYKFVYWLGDVADPTKSTTVTYLDTPKIIIAVFEHIEYEFVASKQPTYGAPGRGGGLTPTAPDYVGRRWQPDTTDEIPIPEPAIFLLFAFAAAILRKNPKSFAKDRL